MSTLNKNGEIIIHLNYDHFEYYISLLKEDGSYDELKHIIKDRTNDLNCYYKHLYRLTNIIVLLSHQFIRYNEDEAE